MSFKYQNPTEESLPVSNNGHDEINGNVVGSKRLALLLLGLVVAILCGGAGVIVYNNVSNSHRNSISSMEVSSSESTVMLSDNCLFCNNWCIYSDFPRPNFETDDPNGWTWCWPLQGGHPGGNDKLCWARYKDNTCPEGYHNYDGCQMLCEKTVPRYCPYQEFPKPNLKKGDPNGWTWCWPLQGGHPGGWDDKVCWADYNTNACPKGYKKTDDCRIFQNTFETHWTSLCVKTEQPCCECIFGNPRDHCPMGSCPC